MRVHARYIVIIAIHGSLSNFAKSMNWDIGKVSRFVHGKYFPKSANEFDLLVEKLNIKTVDEFMSIFFTNLVPRWENREEG